MSEKLRQSLSAVIDDEADEFELRRVLDELDTDPHLRSLWERYHLFGSLLRQECVHQPLAMRERVWLSLDQEVLAGESQEEAEQISRPEIKAPIPASGWFGRRTGLAVAASVAFAVVVGVATLQTSNEVPTAGEVAQAVGPAISDGAPVLREPVVVAPSFRLAADASPSDLRRARAYMLHHTQQKALNQAGVVNFVKMATYEGP
jgi:sigma-E factor negative regulatory protein RseA